MPATSVPHDPVHRARLSYIWRDEHWHLIDLPQPTVVLISDRVSRGTEHPTPEVAEGAFWAGIADSILTHPYKAAEAGFPGVDLAVALDERTNKAHVAERTRSGCHAWEFATLQLALCHFGERVTNVITSRRKAASS